MAYMLCMWKLAEFSEIKVNVKKAFDILLSKFILNSFIEFIQFFTALNIHAFIQHNRSRVAFQMKLVVLNVTHISIYSN